LDPSYKPKAGKSTYGKGKFWSGVAKAAKWGLDICGFAVIDIVNNTAPPTTRHLCRGVSCFAFVMPYYIILKENH